MGILRRDAGVRRRRRGMAALRQSQSQADERGAAAVYFEDLIGVSEIGAEEDSKEAVFMNRVAIRRLPRGFSL